MLAVRLPGARCAAALGAAAAAVASLWCPCAQAATYSVATTTQLVAALNSTGAQGGASTIELHAGTYAPGETLTISGNVTISGPSAAPGAVLSGAGLSPLGSALFDVASGGHATFTDLAMTASGYGNEGAAIDDAGAADLDSSTLSGNDGPALLVESGATATVTNSTVSSNLDGGIEDEGTATLVNSTIADNAIEGIENSSGELSLVNTIVAGNASPDCSSAADVADHSLDSDGTCDIGALSGINPQLGPLAANGGPTLTQALAPASPAIGAADQSRCPTVDQRSYPRAAGACDIGAYQSGAEPATGTAPNPSGGQGGGGGTPTTSPSGAQPGGGSPVTPSTRRVLVGVDGRGTVRGRGGRAATFAIEVATTRPHGSVSYRDVDARVWLRSATVSSVSVDSAHGTVTAVGVATNWAKHARVRFTASATENGSSRRFTLRLSSGYVGGGLLLRGTLANVTRTAAR